MLGSTVVDVDEHGVTIEQADGGTRRIPARTVVWAAGVTASSLAGTGRAHRCRTGPGGPRDGRAGPHAPRPPRGLRARRHGPRPRRRRVGDDPPRRRSGGHAAGTLRGERRPRAPAGPHRPAVPLPGQGQPGHDRPSCGRRGHQRHQAQRLPRVGHVAGRASLLPGGLPEPPSRVHPLGVQLRDARARRAAHHGHSSCRALRRLDGIHRSHARRDS